MQARVDFISLGVRSVAASRRFYVDGLGWPVHMEVLGEVLFIQVNHGLMLSLWDRASMRNEAGMDDDGNDDAGNLDGVSIPGGEGPEDAARIHVPPLTLSHNVDSSDAVDQVVAEAEAAGATVISAGRQQRWGGYTAYLADPDGFRWEIAYNPTWTVDEGGAVTV
jgi:catechol 2,3-dioxygenase-like lactoylglutathione lyase family enzyme